MLFFVTTVFDLRTVLWEKRQSGRRHARLSFSVLFVIMFLFMYNSNHSTKLPDSHWPEGDGEIDAIIDTRACPHTLPRILEAEFGRNHLQNPTERKGH